MSIFSLLKRWGIEPSAEDLADIYWLAMQLGIDSAPNPTPKAIESALRPLPKPLRPAAAHAPTTPVVGAPPNEQLSTAPSQSDPSAPVAAPAQTVPIHGYQQAQPGSPNEDLPITLSAAPALSDQLDLARALKPLMRRVASHVGHTLDEQASAEQIADSQILLPVLRPQPARWLDVMLVLDRAPSMTIWRQAADEWKVLIERMGAFRDVRLWSLETDERNTARLTVGWGRQRREARDPGELTDPSGRRLILMLSDCVAPAWRGGAVQKLLLRWGSRNHVALLQMLPPELWQRSLLGLYDAGSVTATIAAGASSQLSFDEFGLPGVGMPLPVLNLTRESLNSWAALVIGSRAATHGFWITAEVAESSAATVQIEISGEERVQRFKFFASEQAWRLAQALAAAPLSPPVMRLVHQAVVDEPRTDHLAEIMLGGLFRRIPGRSEDFTSDEVQYKFYPGVREQLLDGRPVAEQIGILEHIARFIGGRIGLSFSFRGLLVNPETSDFEALREANPEFATLAVEVLRQMGGRYQVFASKLDKIDNHHKITDQDFHSLETEARITESTVRLIDTGEANQIEQVSPTQDDLVYAELVSYQNIYRQLQEAKRPEDIDALRAEITISLEKLFTLLQPNLERLSRYQFRGYLEEYTATLSHKDALKSMAISLFGVLIEALPTIRADSAKSTAGLLVVVARRRWIIEKGRRNMTREVPLDEFAAELATTDLVEDQIVETLQRENYLSQFQEFLQSSSPDDQLIARERLQSPPSSYEAISRILGPGWAPATIRKRWSRLMNRFRRYLETT